MTTPAHIAFSYLLSQSLSLFGRYPTTSETLAIMVAGNIFDIDYIIGRFLGIKGDSHHNFITHTPIFIITIWLIGLIFFSHYFDHLIWIMILVSALIHLILDNASYWFSKLGWQQISKYPQINWFYPLTPFLKRKQQKDSRSFIEVYLSETKINLVLEMFLTTSAILFYIYF